MESSLFTVNELKHNDTIQLVFESVPKTKSVSQTAVAHIEVSVVVGVNVALLL